MKPLIVQLPYPSVNGIIKNKKLAKMINNSYAGGHSEMTAILQYVYQGFFFEKCNDVTTANLLKSIAIAEMKHLDILGKLILELGLDPVFALQTPCGYDFYSASNVSYSKTLKKMLYDDILGELMAIQGYQKIISATNDQKIIEIISRIKLDEELHVLALEKRLSELS